MFVHVEMLFRLVSIVVFLDTHLSAFLKPGLPTYQKVDFYFQVPVLLLNCGHDKTSCQEKHTLKKRQIISSNAFGQGLFSRTGR